MKLDKKDRLFLINQYRLLASVDKDEAAHYLELIGILENGYEIFYSKVDEWIADDMPAAQGKFVLNILDLYRAIDDLKRSTQDKELNEHHMSVFPGFDGNNEAEYLGFCRFLIEVQGKFSEQKQYFSRNDHLNSHIPMKEKYERMLSAAKSVDSIWTMSVPDALRILAA